VRYLRPSWASWPSWSSPAHGSEAVIAVSLCGNNPRACAKRPRSPRIRRRNQVLSMRAGGSGRLPGPGRGLRRRRLKPASSLGRKLSSHPEIGIGFTCRPTGRSTLEPMNSGAAKLPRGARPPIKTVNARRPQGVADQPPNPPSVRDELIFALEHHSGRPAKTAGPTPPGAVRLGEMPNAKEARASADEGDSGAELGKLGFTLAPAARVAGAGAEGVVITGVDSTGVAADHGFSTGDVILEVAGKSVSTPTDVREVITTARTQGKRTVLVRVKKGDNTRFVALPLGRG